jgi:cell division protein ZapB
MTMEADLKALEEKIGQFVEMTQRLRADNSSLRQQLAQAMNENRRLSEKVDGAKARLEALLERMPDVE